MIKIILVYLVFELILIGLFFYLKRLNKMQWVHLLKWMSLLSGTALITAIALYCVTALF
jgi:hypothetical protein